MSILTDADRATFDTPQRRMVATVRAFEVMIKEFGLTQADVDHCREEVRFQGVNMHAVSIPGAGRKIDDIRAMCDTLDAVFEYMKRNE